MLQGGIEGEGGEGRVEEWIEERGTGREVYCHHIAEFSRHPGVRRENTFTLYVCICSGYATYYRVTGTVVRTVALPAPGRALIA